MRPCTCWFCKNGTHHPENSMHIDFVTRSPENGVQVEHCRTCGHKRPIER